MFYDNLAQVCESNNTKPYAVCKALSIPHPTMYSWRKNGSTPRPAVVSKLADYLKVEPDKLLNEPKHKVTKKTTSTSDKSKLLEAFDSLNARGQTTAVTRLKELSQIQKYHK